MTLDWDYDKLFKNNDVEKLSKIKPKSVTIKKDMWCPHCHGAQTHVLKHKKISKRLSKQSTKIILKAIEENHLEFFTTKDIIRLTKAENLTNGTLQNETLTILSVIGKIRIIENEYEDKKGEKRLRYIWGNNKYVIRPLCYDTINDRHLKSVGWIDERHFDKPKEIKKEERGDDRAVYELWEN